MTQMELTSYEKDKIQRFKIMFKHFVNYDNDKVIDETVDVIFENVEKYYLEFKDAIPYVTIEQEPYEFHVLQPIDGKYDLLDFFINRVFMNVNGIIPGKFMNGYTNNRVILIKVDRYEEHKSSGYTDEDLKIHYRKSKFHEANHAMYMYNPCPRAIGEINTKLSLDEFKWLISMLHHNLHRLYPNVLSPEKIRDINQIGGGLRGPIVQLEESMAEMYAVLFSGMLDNQDNIKLINPPRLGIKNYFIGAPNIFSNCYVGYQRFFYHLRNLCSKESLFNSLFFGSVELLREFADRYQESIDRIWGEIPNIQYILEKVESLNALYRKEGAYNSILDMNLSFHRFYFLYRYAIYEHDEDYTMATFTLNAQTILEKIFVDAYATKVENHDYDDPNELCEQLFYGGKFDFHMLDDDKRIVPGPPSKKYLELYDSLKAQLAMGSCEERKMAEKANSGERRSQNAEMITIEDYLNSDDARIHNRLISKIGEAADAGEVKSEKNSFSL